MQYQPLPAADMTSKHQAAPPDCVVVNLQVVIAGNPGTGDDYRVVGVKAHPTGGGGLHRHHVVDVDRDVVVGVPCGDLSAMTTSPKSGHVELKTEGHVQIKDVVDDGTFGHVEIKNDDGRASGGNPCLVCTEPMIWVAVGRCGHGAVCSKCMVEARFYQMNKRCAICATHCPKVLVTKADGVSDGVATLLKLPRFVFRDGLSKKAGKSYWYHGHTKAYFEDEEQYQHARTECHGIKQHFYEPVFVFVTLFAFLIVIGALLGSPYASEAKHHSSRVRAYAISIFIVLSVGGFFWSVPFLLLRPHDLEHRRRVRDLPPDQQ